MAATTYGPDTDELMKCIQCGLGTALQIYSMNITSLPPLPSTLKYITLYNVASIHSLPELPPSLEVLVICFTNITSLPFLPASLKYLRLENTQISVLPELPTSLIDIYIRDTSLIIPYINREVVTSPDGERILIHPDTPDSYNAKCFGLKTQLARIIKAELVWHVLNS
jgi:invasion plasmid antigen